MIKKINVLSITLIFLIGCSENISPVDSGLEQQIYHHGNGSEPQGIDPHIVTGVPEHHILISLCEGLTIPNPIPINGDGYIPGTAESWSISEDGKEYKISELPLNTKLKNGAIVQSVMKISNVKENGEQREKMFKIISGENKESIIVSGSHLIWDVNYKEFISVEEYSLKYKNESVCREILTEDDDFLCPELSCLITSNHTIPIGEWIFHDWEDNNGSPAKSLER